MKRVIIKYSGEALKDENNYVSNKKMDVLLDTINILVSNNYKVAIVIGGGNLLRGREHTDMEPITADSIGIFASIINALYIKDYLTKHNVKCILKTPFTFPELLKDYSDTFIKDRYEAGEVIIFGGGTGKSGYSTDSAIVRASEILESELIIKLTNVDGVFDKNPKECTNAKLYKSISYEEILDKKLKIMDEYAISKCKEKNINILVMNLSDNKRIIDAIENNSIGTIIGEFNG